MPAKSSKSRKQKKKPEIDNTLSYRKPPDAISFCCATKATKMWQPN